jgi:hypothetical protein
VLKADSFRRIQRTPSSYLVWPGLQDISPQKKGRDVAAPIKIVSNWELDVALPVASGTVYALAPGGGSCQTIVA